MSFLNGGLMHTAVPREFSLGYVYVCVHFSNVSGHCVRWGVGGGGREGAYVVNLILNYELLICSLRPIEQNVFLESG